MRYYKDGIRTFTMIREGKELIESLEERLTGRYLAEDFTDPTTGEVLVSKDKLITEADAKMIVASGRKDR